MPLNYTSEGKFYTTYNGCQNVIGKRGDDPSFYRAFNVLFLLTFTSPSNDLTLS